MKIALGLTAAVSALALSAPAGAVAYLYSITNGTQTLTFSIDSNPTPTGYTTGSNFYLDPVAVTRGNNTFNAELTFYTGAADGGFMAIRDSNDNVLLDAEGDTLFTNGVKNPVMKSGNFTLDGVGAFAGTTYTLSVTPSATGAVPEPSTWAMLIGGMGLVGGAMRARRTSVRYESAI